MWLLESSVLQQMQSAQTKSISADDISAFISTSRSSTKPHDNVMSVSDGKAEITINGVLTKTPSFMAMFFGGGNTTYNDLAAAVDFTESSDEINSVDYIFDSPGGNVDGLFQLCDLMKSSSKPSHAKISGTCASAAYALATQCDTISADHRANRIGSLGVVVDAYIDDSVVSITSTNAPRKRPDLSTDEGKELLRAELDDLHDLFVDAVSSGRGKTKEDINANFGRGGVVLAESALKRGMIDAVEIAAESTKTTNAHGGDNNMESSMDIEQLKASHPHLHAEVLEKGVAKERDRVCAHLISGEKSGDVQTASAAIRDGSEMTATLQATYMTAGMNRADITARGEDDRSADAGDTASDSIDVKTEASTVADLLEAKMGLGDHYE